MSKGSPFKRSYDAAASTPQNQRFDFANNPFMQRAAASAKLFSGPGYLPPQEASNTNNVYQTTSAPTRPPPPPPPAPTRPATIPCSGNGRVCVPNYLCNNGAVDASQVNGASSQVITQNIRELNTYIPHMGKGSIQVDRRLWSRSHHTMSWCDRFNWVLRCHSGNAQLIFATHNNIGKLPRPTFSDAISYRIVIVNCVSSVRLECKHYKLSACRLRSNDKCDKCSRMRYNCLHFGVCDGPNEWMAVAWQYRVAVEYTRLSIYIAIRRATPPHFIYVPNLLFIFVFAIRLESGDWRGLEAHGPERSLNRSAELRVHHYVNRKHANNAACIIIYKLSTIRHDTRPARIADAIYRNICGRFLLLLLLYLFWNIVLQKSCPRATFNTW